MRRAVPVLLLAAAVRVAAASRSGAAERLRRALQENAPIADKMPEQQMNVLIDHFIDARGGHLQPTWENNTHGERTANLRRHAGQRRRERRRLQTDSFAGTTSGFAPR